MRLAGFFFHLESRMNRISKFAAAFMLGAVVVVPSAYAQKDDKKKKEEAAKPVKRTLSKAFESAYRPAVEALVKKKDFAAANTAFAAAEAAISTPDDRHEAGIFAISLGRELKDVGLQRKGVDMVVASGVADPKMLPVYILQQGLYLYQDKDYPAAEKKLLEAYNSGYRGNSIELQLSNTYRLQNNYPEAINWLQKAIDAAKASGGKAETQWYAQAVSYATRLKDNGKILYWGREMLKADPRAETFHDAIFQYQRIADLDSQESLSLLRLARRNSALLFEHEYKQYVEYADARRYPAEVVAVLDEGFAKGTISKNNLTFSEIYNSAKARIPELSVGWDADEKSAKADAKGFAALLVGDNLLSFGQFARAKGLYEAALAKGNIIDRDGVNQTDRALTNLAIAKVNLGDYAGAKADLAQISGEKRKGIAEYWTIYIDQQMAKAAAPAAPAA
jgi:tetratricopeptide (TPR) repeat protein